MKRLLLLLIVCGVVCSACSFSSDKERIEELENEVEEAYHRGYMVGYEDAEGFAPTDSDIQNMIEDAGDDYYELGYWEGYLQCYKDYKNKTLDRSIVGYD